MKTLIATALLVLFITTSVNASDLTKHFYNDRVGEPLWTKAGKMVPQIKSMLKAIDDTQKDGLDPKGYHQDILKEFADRYSSGETLSSKEMDEFERSLSDAFFDIALHYQKGVLDPFGYKPTRFAQKEEPEIFALLLDGFEKNAVATALLGLLPDDPRYVGLKKAYQNYKKLYADAIWPKITKGEKIKAGDTDPRVPLLRERLIGEGWLKKHKTSEADGGIFDEALAKALADFQRANGLLDDGVLGDYSVAVLNISAQERIQQMAANLDRFRGYSKDLRDDEYVLVNIPDFMARLYSGGNIEWESRAIVGRVDRKSPRLNAQIRYIVFSPKWNVPTKIAVEDKIPKIKEDPDFIKKNRMKIFAKADGELKEVSSDEVDWSTLNKDNFDYLIVQDPGDDNALGRIKFIFPNKDDVYLHDTPTKKLFESTTRNFSSGCIRVQRPVELAEYLLQDKPEWTKEKIEKEMSRKSELYVYLTRPMPIHIFYFTSWVDAAGQLQFRRDLYGFDKAYRNML